MVFVPLQIRRMKTILETARTLQSMNVATQTSIFTLSYNGKGAQLWDKMRINETNKESILTSSELGRALVTTEIGLLVTRGCIEGLAELLAECNFFSTPLWAKVAKETLPKSMSFSLTTLDSSKSSSRLSTPRTTCSILASLSFIFKSSRRPLGSISSSERGNDDGIGPPLSR